MPDIANVSSRWTSGVLEFVDSDNNIILSIYPSSGGVKFANAGGVTISTGILGGVTISTGVLGGLTVSSGLTLDGETGSTATVNTTLAVGTHGGKVVKCATDGVFFTLPSGALPGVAFAIKNTAAAAAAQIILRTGTGENIIGAGITTSATLSNTKATAVKGDYVSVISAGSTTWYITGMVGTWASTT